MQIIPEMVKLLTKHDIPTKNALSVLGGLTLVLVLHIKEILQDFDKYGSAGVAAAALAAFLLGFVLAHLICTAIGSIYRRRMQQMRTLRKKEQDYAEQVNVLNSLSDWQKSFLVQAARSEQCQFHSSEIGEYEVLWRDEMDVLIQKGIVIHHFGTSIYEVKLGYLNQIAELIRDGK